MEGRRCGSCKDWMTDFTRQNPFAQKREAENRRLFKYAGTRYKTINLHSTTNKLNKLKSYT